MLVLTGMLGRLALVKKMGENCKRILRQFHRFVSMELDEHERTMIERHLELCQPCHARFRFERYLRRLISLRAQRDGAPPSLRAKIMMVLRTDV